MTRPLVAVPDTFLTAVPNRRLLVVLDRILQRVVALHGDLSREHVTQLEAELSLFERVLDDVQHQLEWSARQRLTHLLQAGTPGGNILDWHPTSRPDSEKGPDEFVGGRGTSV